MSVLTKSNQRETQPTLAPPFRRQKNKVRPVSVITPYLRHLNTGTLAFVMFVILAVLSPIRGKNSENTGPAPANEGSFGRSITNRCVEPQQFSTYGNSDDLGNPERI